MKKEFLQLINISKNKHKDYMNNGKTFFYAKEIKFINLKILDLIKDKNFTKSTELQKIILDLEIHLNEWIFAWNNEQINKNPKDNDLFVFDGYKKYPKELDTLLINS